ncbi:MAG: prepilin-type N-terminal cleavage/methylation domain-containing protein [Leptospiraceae bacterium]|nr:prepilin-type N-terminal cleavage/methylation domain-containing protein [Leptospiraceae bacterium]
MKLFLRNKSRFRKGITLIELAIVIAILSVLFAGIFGAYYSAIRITKSSSPKNGTDRQSILYALENIRSTLTQTFFAEGHRRLIFIGKKDGLLGQRTDKVVFAANHPNAEETGKPAIREVAFYCKEMGSGSELYYLIRREDEMVDRTPESGGVEHVLLEHVKSFQLKYSQRGDKWVDEWSSRDMKQIPKLIRIEIVALVGNNEIKYESLANPGLFFK